MPAVVKVTRGDTGERSYSDDGYRGVGLRDPPPHFALREINNPTDEKKVFRKNLTTGKIYETREGVFEREIYYVLHCTPTPKE